VRRQAAAGAGALGVELHRLGELAHAGGGLLQRGGLLLGAPRQVGVAAVDLPRGNGDGVGRALDARDQARERVLHVAQGAQQPAEVAAALGLELLAQIARSHGLGDENGLIQRLADGAHQPHGATQPDRQPDTGHGDHPAGQRAHFPVDFRGGGRTAQVQHLVLQASHVVQAADAQRRQHQHEQQHRGKAQGQHGAGLHVREGQARLLFS
jgi:hypothetical protein